MMNGPNAPLGSAKKRLLTPASFANAIWSGVGDMVAGDPDCSSLIPINENPYNETCADSGGKRRTWDYESALIWDGLISPKRLPIGCQSPLGSAKMFKAPFVFNGMPFTEYDRGPPVFVSLVA